MGVGLLYPHMSNQTTLTELATQFLELYKCNPNVHGETKLTGKFRDRDGKCDSKSFLVKSGVTVIRPTRAGAG